MINQKFLGKFLIYRYETEKLKYSETQSSKESKKQMGPH